jgi:hypothetical protein
MSDTGQRSGENHVSTRMRRVIYTNKRQQAEGQKRGIKKGAVARRYKAPP